jgi:signal transduction histidine kinase
MTSGTAERRLRRVGASLYLVVLVGGLYFVLAGIWPAPSWAVAGFIGGIAALLALELSGLGGALTRLLARAALIHAVALVDGSQLSRALFLLVPFAAYLGLSRRAGLVTAAGYGLGLVGWLTVAVPGWWTAAEQVSDLLMFGVGLVFAVSMAGFAVTADASRGRAVVLLAELADSHQRLGEYAEQVGALAAAEERNRLARDIHDSLGHHLTAVSIQLDKAIAYRERDPVEADRAVADARGSAKAALAEVRGSVASLRSNLLPAPGDGLPEPSLAGSLAALVAQLDTGSVVIDCGVHGDERAHVAAWDTLYRTAQEGLTNAVRHAAAGRIAVTVRFTAQAATLTVRDDGRGLPAELPARSGFGLAGMRERLAAAGGTLHVCSAPGGGTALTATVPRAGIGAAVTAGDRR